MSDIANFTRDTSKDTQSGTVYTREWYAEYYTNSAESIKLVAKERYDTSISNVPSTITVVPYIKSATAGNRHIIGKLSIGGKNASSTSQGRRTLYSGSLYKMSDSGWKGMLRVDYEIYTAYGKYYIEGSFKGALGFNSSANQYLMSNASNAYFKLLYNGNEIYSRTLVNTTTSSPHFYTANTYNTNSGAGDDGYVTLYDENDNAISFSQEISSMGDGKVRLQIWQCKISGNGTTSVPVIGNTGSGNPVYAESDSYTLSGAAVIETDTTYGEMTCSLNDEIYAPIETTGAYIAMIGYGEQLKSFQVNRALGSPYVDATDDKTYTDVTPPTIYFTIANTTIDQVYTGVSDSDKDAITTDAYITYTLVLETLKLETSTRTGGAVVSDIDEQIFEDFKVYKSDSTTDYVWKTNPYHTDFNSLGSANMQLLPSIYYDGELVPLGNSTNTIFVDEGLSDDTPDENTVRNWYLYIKNGSDTSLIFDSLGSAMLGVDVFLCGGGGGGGSGTMINDYALSGTIGPIGTITSFTYPSNQTDDFGKRALGGGGGAGGATRSICGLKINAQEEYTVTVGDGGEHGMSGGATYAFDYVANGGKPGKCGYEDDDESGEESSTSSSSSSDDDDDDDLKGGEAGEAVRTVSMGFSRAGGTGAAAYEVTNNSTSSIDTRDATAGQPGTMAFEPGTTSTSAKGCIPMIGILYGSGGGGGACTYSGLSTTTTLSPSAGGSSQAGSGGKNHTSGKVNYTNGPIGQDGTANTGGGGGGGGCSNYVQTFGGKGGSGIVIIRNSRNPENKYKSLTKIITGSASRTVSVAITTKKYYGVQNTGSSGTVTVQNVDYTGKKSFVQAASQPNGGSYNAWTVNGLTTKAAPTAKNGAYAATTLNQYEGAITGTVNAGAKKSATVTTGYNSVLQTLYGGLQVASDDLPLNPTTLAQRITTVTVTPVMWHQNGISGNCDVTGKIEIQYYIIDPDDSTKVKWTSKTIFDTTSTENKYKVSLTNTQNTIQEAVANGNGVYSDMSIVLTGVVFNNTRRTVPCKMIVTNLKVSNGMKALTINTTQSFELEEAN